MGEVLPNSMQLMAKAAQRAGLSTNGTIKEMLALQQTGSLISSKVLPHFSDLLHEAAVNNGGLENAMLSNRVAMNRMATATQVAADTIFKSGWGKGLTELFNSTADMIKENEVFFKAFGATVEGVFNAISHTITYVIGPAFKALGYVLDHITRALGSTGTEIVAFGVGLFVLIKNLRGLSFVLALVGGSATAAMAPFLLWLGTLSAIVLALEDIATFAKGGESYTGDMVDYIKDNPVKAVLSATPLGGMYSGGKKAYNSLFGETKQAPINVTNQVEVILNAEQVGSAVGSTEGVKSAIDHRMSIMGSNY